MKRRALLLLCLLLIPPAVSAQNVLRWGADPSGGAPYVFSDPAHPDKYIGYELEMVEALAAAMNRKPEFVPTDWETIVTSLQRGEFDVVVNGLEPTEDRARVILFSKPYYVFQLQLTVRKNETRINKLEDCRTARGRHARQHRRLASDGEGRDSLQGLRRPRGRLPRP